MWEDLTASPTDLKSGCSFVPITLRSSVIRAPLLIPQPHCPCCTVKFWFSGFAELDTTHPFAFSHCAKCADISSLLLPLVVHLANIF